MALKKQMCKSHPDRPAIGICTITKVPICAECSTRYEGVNYSKEGLKILQSQRTQKHKVEAGGTWIVGAVVIMVSPAFLYFIYYFFLLSSQWMIDILQQTWGA